MVDTGIEILEILKHFFKPLVISVKGNEAITDHTFQNQIKNFKGDDMS